MNIEPKYRPWLVVGVIIVILVLGYVFSKPGSEVSNTGDEGNNQNQNGGTPPAQNVSDDFVGILKISDNTAKGNLMLENSKRKLYLNTSRDYSAMIGKEVVLQVEGTIEQFRLIDIKAK